MSDYNDEWGPATHAVRTGYTRGPEGAHSEPIYTTSSYVFASAEEAAARFAGDEPGYIYSRFTNPTVRCFEERMAALEGGEACVAFASGMAAILATCLGLLKAGDHIVAAKGIFGTTTVLFEKYMQRFGIETSFVSLTNLGEWEAAMRPETRLLFIETPSNPISEIADIKTLANLAHAFDALLAVDNTLCTGVLQRPLNLGADLSIVSATKYIDGQGRTLGGAVIGDAKLVGEEVFGVLRTGGPALSPMNAWVLLKGLETLAIRMAAHSAAALEIAKWLVAHPAVERVYYPGLPDHPQHELAKAQQTGFGGLLAFELKGGREQAWAFINGTRMISITANLGDAKTTITHPATTTHGRLTPEQRAEAGIKDNLVRLAAGLEEVADIKADLQRGFDAIY